MSAWQSGLYAALESKGFKPTPNGSYLAPESAAEWFTCGARTNADAKPAPRTLGLVELQHAELAVHFR